MDLAVNSRTIVVKTKKNNKIKKILKDFDLYLLLIPGLIFIGIFSYAPMYGATIAFKDFNIFAGILGSPWVGLTNFEKLFTSPDFLHVFLNTLIISLYKIVILFPFPIIIALMLNEIRHIAFKKSVQTILYLPHFLSWVIIAGLFANILSPSGGIVNLIIKSLGGESISFLSDNRYFRGVLVFTAGWKEAGWNTIIYIAAIAGIDSEQYEAAKIDGAGRLKQIRHVTIPGIMPTIIMLLILRLGHVLDAGTEQILMLYNPLVYESADVIGTFVYRVGIGKMDYSFTTAVGLFNSVIGFILVMNGNYLSKKYQNMSIW